MKNQIRKTVLYSKVLPEAFRLKVQIMYHVL